MTVSSLFPMLPWWVAAALFAGVLGLALWGWVKGGVRGLFWHAVPALAFTAALADPRLISERSHPLDDIALVLLDESPSMTIGARAAQAEQAAAETVSRLKALPGLDVRLVRHRNRDGQDEGTRLFATLDAALADLPRRRLAGVVMITDGAVADVPERADPSFPLHLLLAGGKNERDRRLTLENAPAFGLVGSTVTLSFKIDDPGHDAPVPVSIRIDGGALKQRPVLPNRLQSIEIPVTHAGQTIVEIEAEVAPDELSRDNNRAILSVSGVRDRLRVLLVSGEPHAGGRTWRNLLKADPAVDLVHFTILRVSEENDRTPLQDLSLIAFPVQELFERRLSEFDLVILDRYRRSVFLTPGYYRNLADYVHSGGALLMAAGPEFGDSDSLYDTPLDSVLPAAPTGEIAEGPFKPRITALGRRHPVTADLPGAGGKEPDWGPWMRRIGAEMRGSGQVVMAAPGGQPLLVLKRVGSGRVASLLSDSAWLWGRGWRGGGPQAELLRRLAHWLMKETELEEERLKAEIRDRRLWIERRSLTPGPVTIEVTAPDGASRPLDLAARSGRAQTSLPADQAGLWRVSDGMRTALAAAGPLEPVEMADPRAGPERIAPALAAGGGGVRWIEDGMVEMRRIRGAAAGPSWFGFRVRDERSVDSIEDIPMIPPILLLFAGLGGLVLAWWRQGR